MASYLSDAGNILMIWCPIGQMQGIFYMRDPLSEERHVLPETSVPAGRTGTFGALPILGIHEDTYTIHIRFIHVYDS
jgi:hypothetical protein